MYRLSKGPNVVNQLKATDELVSHLERVHSVLQFEDQLGFADAVKLATGELELTGGYVELLVELLVEREEFAFVLVAGDDGYSKHVLKFTGVRDLDIDLFDLERLDLAAASKRLANRLGALKIERGEANAPVRLRAKRERDLTTAIAKVGSAEDALQKAEKTRMRLMADLEKANRRVDELTLKRDAERRHLEGLREQDDN